MADIIRFPVADAARAEEKRMTMLYGARPLFTPDGNLDAEAACVGDRKEWAWSAAVYLKAVSWDAQGHMMSVSKSAVALVLGEFEEMAGRLGIIGQPPAGDAA